MNYVYVLQSKKHNKCYVGFTTDLRKRVHEHNSGLSNFTVKGIPWELIYYEAYRDETIARERERKIKQHGRVYTQLLKRITKQED